MKVKATSWHFKVWKWMQEPTHPIPVPSVCGYWSTIFIQFPLMCIVVAVMVPTVGPLVWLGNKLDKWGKGKTFCPFGKVDIEK